jgi:vancomycin resistance protein VanW
MIGESTGKQQDADLETIRRGKKRLSLELIALVLAPVALLLFLFLTDPFKETLDSRSINLSKYTSSQRLNFLTAAKALDGTVIKPRAIFSFNGRVGPRLSGRGFVPAPGYLAGQKQSTTGGGICVISSTLYQVALLSSLPIVERTAHTNTIKSVAPGLDATVWYGRTDLKFKNPYNAPVAIACSEDGDNLYISLKGDTVTKMIVSSKEPTLRRCQIACGRDSKNILVEVFLKDGESEHRISRDRYRFTP